MKHDILEGKWLQVQGKVKERWGELTDDDLEQISGKRDQLEGKLRERYGYSKRQARSEVDKFLSEVNGQASDAREKVKTRVKETQDRVQERVREAQGRLQQQVETTKEQVGTRAEHYDEELRRAAPEDVVYVVEEYPWLVIIGALLLGVVIGLLVGPNRR